MACRKWKSRQYLYSLDDVCDDKPLPTITIPGGGIFFNSLKIQNRIDRVQVFFIFFFPPVFYRVCWAYLRNR